MNVNLLIEDPHSAFDATDRGASANIPPAESSYLMSGLSSIKNMLNNCTSILCQKGPSEDYFPVQQNCPDDMPVICTQPHIRKNIHYTDRICEPARLRRTPSVSIFTHKISNTRINGSHRHGFASQRGHIMRKALALDNQDRTISERDQSNLHVANLQPNALLPYQPRDATFPYLPRCFVVSCIIRVQNMALQHMMNDINELLNTNRQHNFHYGNRIENDISVNIIRRSPLLLNQSAMYIPRVMPQLIDILSSDRHRVNTNMNNWLNRIILDRITLNDSLLDDERPHRF